MKYDPKNDAYEILGLEAGATLDEIKAGYRSVVQGCHPDKNGGSCAASEMTKKVNGAWANLRAPAQRQAYDTARLQYLCPAPSASLPLVRLRKVAPRTAVEFAAPLINQFARKGEVFSAIGLFAAMAFLDGNN